MDERPAVSIYCAGVVLVGIPTLGYVESSWYFPSGRPALAGVFCTAEVNLCSFCLFCCFYLRRLFPALARARYLSTVRNERRRRCRL